MELAVKRFLITIALVASFGLAWTGVALAHEHRTVGKYELVVGFDGEPALAGQPNAAGIRIQTAADKQPVEGAEDTLKLEIIHGKDTMTAELEAEFGQPGYYVAHFVPSVAGDYAFHFTGTIGDQAVDERFESGPKTFSTVDDPATMMFPAVAKPAAATNTGALLSGVALVASLVALAVSGLALRRRAA